MFYLVLSYRERQKNVMYDVTNLTKALLKISLKNNKTSIFCQLLILIDVTLTENKYSTEVLSKQVFDGNQFNKRTMLFSSLKT